jgi:hypothetical protein
MGREIYVHLFTGEDGWPDKACDFVGWLNGLIAQAPEDMRDAIKIDITGGTSYDYGYTEIDIFYVRPETDDELKARLNKEEKAAVLERARTERAERHAYDLLKKKYER